MSIRLLIDESVNYNFVHLLRKNNYEVKSIYEDSPSITDEEVLSKSVSLNAILVTEDKDFGDWIFAHGKKGTGIILLRYPNHELRKISKALLKILNKYRKELYRLYIVITPNKIRIREEF